MVSPKKYRWEMAHIIFFLLRRDDYVLGIFKYNSFSSANRHMWDKYIYFKQWTKFYLSHITKVVNMYLQRPLLVFKLVINAPGSVCAFPFLRNLYRAPLISYIFIASAPSKLLHPYTVGVEIMPLPRLRHMSMLENKN